MTRASRYLTRALIGFWTQNTLNLVAVGMGLVLDLAATALRHSLDPAMVSLAVVYSLSMMSLMAGVVRNYADVENNMTSVERLEHFCTKVEQEQDQQKALKGTLSPPPPPPPPQGEGEGERLQWPSAGAIEFRRVSLRYRRGLPLALRQLQLSIPARAKVALGEQNGRSLN